MDTIELILQSRKGDKDARNRVVMENVGLIWSIVRRFLGRGYDAEDLFQIGSIGLMKAIDKFDTGYDVKFSTYAVPMISGEIKRFLRDDGMVKVSRTLKENNLKIRQAAQRLANELGRDATLDELAAATELSVEDVVMAMEANIEVESIYRSIYQSDGNEIYLVDQVVAGGREGTGRMQGSDGQSQCVSSGDAEKEKLLDHLLLRQLLGELKPKERDLIIMRYFQNKTQTEVAKKMGISQVQVSRLEKKILLSMRQKAD